MNAMSNYGDFDQKVPRRSGLVVQASLYRKIIWLRGSDFGFDSTKLFNLSLWSVFRETDNDAYMR